MPQNVRVLTPTERAVALGLGLVLAAGTVSAAVVSAPAAPTFVPVADVLAPSPAAPAAAPAVPVVTPTPAPPAPARRSVTVAAALGPLPAPAEPPRTGCPPPKRTGGPSVPRPQPAPAVADADLPAPLPAGPKAASLDAVAGKGIWVTNWPKTALDEAALVAKVKAAGLQSVWVRTGGSRQGYYGDRVLPRLVPAAHAAGLKVVAWDFPFLSDPTKDALRAKQALEAGIDAFAPDVETSAEGTFATPQRIATYLSMVRRYAGQRPLAATVPRPTDKRLAGFPYGAFQPYADVFAPMVYWSCNEPGALVAQSLARLGRWLPVAPVGQAYDMGTEGGRRGLPSQAETWRFLDAAQRGGAVGASLWTIEKVGAGQWTALSRYPWAAPPS